MHGRQKSFCRKGCATNSVYCIPHGVAKSRCTKCRGSSVCRHGRRIQICMFCMPDSPELCKNKCGRCLSGKITRDRGTCGTCHRRKERQIRLEHEWLEKFNEWGYFVTINDKVIRDDKCNIVNRRRVDFLFVTEVGFPYHIVVECDENSHGGSDISCEMKRLQEVHDQLIANTAEIKPIAIIRFNPSSGMKIIENEMKEAMDELFKGEFKVTDIRGVNIFKVIGYGKTRGNLYREKKITKQLSINDIKN